MVQTMKNRRFHRGIKRSPYEAMFGKALVLGNEDKKMPTEEERGVDSEEGEEVTKSAFKYGHSY
jgi:hypothetical protein